MSKRFFLVLMVFVYFLGVKVASASVIISEIMYNSNNGDPDWVEVYSTENITIKSGNTGDTWHFVSGSSNYHFVGSDFSINAGDYFIFTCNKDEFVLNHPEVPSDKVIDITAIGINNSGTILKILDENEGLINSVEFTSSQGANGDGKSLQLQSDGITWKANTPSPGEVNTDLTSNSDPIDPGGTTTTTTTSSSGGSSTTVKKEKEAPKVIPVFSANILVPTIAFAGKPVDFDLNVKYGDETYACGKYFWNFGDGVSLEKSGGFEKFSHTYFYPGEYNISLEYYKSSGSLSPEITKEITIKVIPLTVSISRVGDYKDFFVELTNNADSKIDISKWILSANNKFFTIPKNTVISSKKSIIISGKITGFTVTDEANLKLTMPTGEIVFDYGNSLVSSTKIAVNNSQKVSTENYLDPNKVIVSKNEIPTKGIEANSLLSQESKQNYLFYIILFFLLGVSGFGVYFIRRKKNVSKPNENDFEILDE